jgi:hypothetical protein
LEKAYLIANLTKEIPHDMTWDQIRATAIKGFEESENIT